MSSLKSDPVGGGGEYGHLKLNTQGNFRELYKVGSILGEGAFGTVRLVTSRADGSKWAVKVIEKSTVTPGDHALRTEIDILCRVDHVNCVCLREWFDEPKRVLLVMEYISGGTLFDKIVADGRYDERTARRHFIELARGLAYLHECGIAHRDLKPENFMLARDGDRAAAAKLTDYGLSKILDVVGGGGEKTICGTPSYVAPEIVKMLQGGDQDGTYNALAADAWSLGCNLYVLLSGYPPFWRYEDNQKKLFEHVAMNDWSFDQPCWKDVSEGGKALVRALMEPDLEKRLTVADALDDPWCRKAAGDDAAGEGGGKDLSAAFENIRLRVLNRRFRKAGLVIMANNRFAKGVTHTAKE